MTHYDVVWDGRVSQDGQQDTDLLLCAGIPTKRDAPPVSVPIVVQRRRSRHVTPPSYSDVRAYIERHAATVRDLMMATALPEHRVRAVICRLQRQRLICSEWIPVKERTERNIWTRYRWSPR